MAEQHEAILLEDFGGPQPSPALEWEFPPPSAVVEGGSLKLHIAAATDYWQRTHYGFQVHNGAFLRLSDVKGDFIMCTHVTTEPRDRFDQAGLMVQLSPSCWLKTSVEHWQGPGKASQLGVVVTNAGFSDWSTQDFPQDIKTIALRVRREGSDYIVEACVPEGSVSPEVAARSPIRVASGATDSPPSEWTQLRIAHLLEDVSPAAVSKDKEANVAFGKQLDDLAALLPLSGVRAGLYACSPKPGEGFSARFSHLHVLRGRVAGLVE